ncbi:MAG: HAMP domain-containing protein [Clostridia bacterium]|nr:HAMP domain-containing protein [Clostridia bacterium]
MKLKRKLSEMSLRKRYSLMITAIIMACFLLLSLALVIFSGNYWYRQKAELLTENAHNVAQSASDLLSGGYISMFGDGDSIAALGSSLSLISTSIEADVFLCDTTGHIIMCRDFLVDGSVVSEACYYHDNLIITQNIINDVLLESYSTVSNLGGQFDEAQFIVGEPVQVAGHTVALVFAVAPVTNAIIDFVMPIARLLIISLLVVMLFAVLAVYFVSHTITKPIKQMADVTRSYAAGDFSPRVKLERSDEIGQLAASFNTMASSLAQLETSRRSFVANVSHELKTPMTTIGGFIDGILDETIPPEQQEHYLKIVSDEVKRLSRIVVSMLNLSKIEAGQLDLNFNNVDLSAMLLNTFLMLEKKISDGRIEIRGLDLLGQHIVRADSDLLGQVVYNLVDNAVKFTPENGYISVSIVEKDDYTETHILNSGSGIAPDELDRIFERFYKVDKSRSADAKSTGLGLYIVKSILELHNGKIYAESIEGRYTEFVFVLPKNK